MQSCMQSCEGMVKTSLIGVLFFIINLNLIGSVCDLIQSKSNAELALSSLILLILNNITAIDILVIYKTERVAQWLVFHSFPTYYYMIYRITVMMSQILTLEGPTEPKYSFILGISIILAVFNGAKIMHLLGYTFCKPHISPAFRLIAGIYSLIALVGFTSLIFTASSSQVMKTDDNDIAVFYSLTILETVIFLIWVCIMVRYECLHKVYPHQYSKYVFTWKLGFLLAFYPITVTSQIPGAISILSMYKNLTSNLEHPHMMLLYWMVLLCYMVSSGLHFIQEVLQNALNNSSAAEEENSLIGQSVSAVSLLEDNRIMKLTLGRQSDECVICWESMEDAEKLVAVRSCKHTFHVHCLEHWVHHDLRCPMCRVKI